MSLEKSSLRNINWHYGVALREPHFESFRSSANRCNAIEVVAENYIFTRGERRQLLIELSQKHFTHLHCVSGNIASFDPLDEDWMAGLKSLALETSAALISDHLCFTRLNQHSTFELLPPPMTENMVHHIGQRVQALSTYLSKDFLLENISRYFAYMGDEMSEVDFMNALYNNYGVQFLLDVNNVYVSAQNLELSPEAYLQKLSPGSIKAFHIGGFEMVEGFHFDTHGASVHTEVQRLFSKAVERFGKVPTFLERDENIPEDLKTLEDEIDTIIEAAL